MVDPRRESSISPPSEFRLPAPDLLPAQEWNQDLLTEELIKLILTQSRPIALSWCPELGSATPSPFIFVIDHSKVAVLKIAGMGYRCSAPAERLFREC